MAFTKAWTQATLPLSWRHNRMVRKPLPAEAAQDAEIVQLQDASTAEDLDPLLWETAMPICQIGDHRDRAVFEPEGYGRLVLGGRRAVLGARCRRCRSTDRCARQEAGQIDEMTGLADDAPAADRLVLGPMVRGDTRRR